MLPSFEFWLVLVLLTNERRIPQSTRSGLYRYNVGHSWYIYIYVFVTWSLMILSFSRKVRCVLPDELMHKACKFKFRSPESNCIRTQCRTNFRNPFFCSFWLRYFVAYCVSLLKEIIINTCTHMCYNGSPALCSGGLETAF